MRARWLALLGVILASAPARAMDYSLGDPDENRFIYATGSIEEGEALRFRRFLAAQPQWIGKTFVVLNSPGGLVADALALARFVELEKFMTGVAPSGSCSSACTLVWAAGSRKFVNPDTCIGVHNAITVKDKVTATWAKTMRDTEATQATGMMALWLKDHGAPAAVTIKLFTTPSADMYCLTPDDLAAWHAKIVVVK